MSGASHSSGEVGAERVDYKLRIQSLRDKQDVLTFPCDESGCVDMDAMDDATRNRYLYARALVGIEYAMARVAQPYADFVNGQ